MISQKLKKNIAKIFSVLIFSGLFLNFQPAFAQTSLRSLLKEVAERVEEIFEVKNNQSLNEEEKAKRELEVRKEALSKIFDLTLLEDKDLKNRLLALKDLNEKQKRIQAALVGLLSENENAYQEMRQRLEGADSLKAVKQLAADFKIWRHNVYNPKVEKILSFTLIFQQKKTLAIANDRLKKIKSDLARLEDAKIIQEEDTASLLKKAVAALQKAGDLNNQAEVLVAAILYEEFFPSAPDPSQKEIDNPEEIKLGSAKSVKNLVEESLKEIRTAYRLFIDIGKVVREKISSK